ncbi:MAG: carboxy terminal-processing peptidase, partial [Candidatus Cloacimonetes bacterium]|nr:carboxy terminal-processing peptidase [Candidatus Cloacimonadota bacterium]
RIDSSPAFNEVIRRNEKLKKMVEDTIINLNIDKMISERLETRSATKDVRDKLHVNEQLKINHIQTGWNLKSKQDREQEEEFTKNLRRDIYIDEAMNIISDMIRMDS